MARFAGDPKVATRPTMWLALPRQGDGMGDNSRGDRLMEKRKKWVQAWEL